MKQPKERHYPAVVKKIYDGDTITCLIDLGLETMRTETVRFSGVDAPELNTPAGKDVQKFLDHLLKDKEITLVTLNDKHEKYGRRMAYVMLDGINVNQLLLEKGFARPYDGGKRVV